MNTITSESDIVNFVEFYTICFGEDEGALFTEYVNEKGVLRFAESLFTADSIYIEAKVVGTLKYPFAYHRILGMLATEEDANAWDLPYLFEADQDLDCAVSMYGMRQLKHSAQMLRSAIESAIIHAYFSTLGVPYESLHSLTIPMMTLHRGGMLRELVDTGFLMPSAAERVAFLYQDLSAATHSHYRYLGGAWWEEGPDAETALRLLYRIREVSRACLSIALAMAHATNQKDSLIYQRLHPNSS